MPKKKLDLIKCLGPFGYLELGWIAPNLPVSLTLGAIGYVKQWLTDSVSKSTYSNTWMEILQNAHF